VETATTVTSERDNTLIRRKRCSLQLSHFSKFSPSDKVTSYTGPRGYTAVLLTATPTSAYRQGWLGSRVVSVLDSGAEGPGSNRSRDAVGQQS